MKSLSFSVGKSSIIVLQNLNKFFEFGYLPSDLFDLVIYLKFIEALDVVQGYPFEFVPLFVCHCESSMKMILIAL
jgi:hypothetical protein